MHENDERQMRSGHGKSIVVAAAAATGTGT
jgi:hypothetical protein